MFFMCPNVVLVLPTTLGLWDSFLHSMSRSRYWLFTINNPDETACQFEERLKSIGLIKFYIFQLERGGTTGTDHFQGYIGLSSQRALSWLSNTITARGHYEARRGTHQEAVDYCSKEDTRISGPYQNNLPTSAGQGDRTDIQRGVILLREGGLARVAEEAAEILVRYPRGFSMLNQFLPTPERPPCDIILCFGPTGVGKTRWAVDSSNGDFYKHEPRSAWFDGYVNQTSIIVDEYSGWWSLDYLLSFCDRYPHRLQIKGGFAWLRASRIIFTANTHPRDWYNYAGRSEQLAALARRFTRVIEFSRDGGRDIRDTTVGVGRFFGVITDDILNLTINLF